MIQVCDPPRTRQVRRLSAEEFCRLAQSEVSSVYRPRSEVLRMLTVGEVWGVYSTRGVPGAGCILLPMDADVAAAAALRRFLGWNRTSGGYFLTPAAGRTAMLPRPLHRCWLRLLPGRSFLPGSGHGGPWWNVRQKS